MVNEFAHHLIGHPFLSVDVEKDVAESVYLQLKGEFNTLFFRLSKSLISNMLPDFERSLLVRDLASESQLDEQDGIPVPTLEKLFIYLFSSPNFYFFRVAS
jgi:hypothetical protein